MTHETKLRKASGAPRRAITGRKPKARRRPGLDELLTETKRAPRYKKDFAWVAGGPVGRESI